MHADVVALYAAGVARLDKSAGVVVQGRELDGDIIAVATGHGRGGGGGLVWEDGCQLVGELVEEGREGGRRRVWVGAHCEVFPRRSWGVEKERKREEDRRRESNE